MATVSIVHTPPPHQQQRTSAMFTTSTSTTILSRHSSPSSRSTPERACQALLIDDGASSSDKENSPATAYMARNASNTNATTKIAQSPSIDVSLISEKPSTVSFTPQRVKAPPRAWERRPATPHVPRNEQQKIWKRVPLGEIGIRTEGNGRGAMGEMMRSEREEKRDYVRVVKRLKMDGSADPGVRLEGEENESGSGDGIALGTKVEMDQIEMMGSPKKKTRRMKVVEVEVVKSKGDVDVNMADGGIEEEGISQSVLSEEKAAEDVAIQLESSEYDRATGSDTATQFPGADRMDEIADTPVETLDADKEHLGDDVDSGGVSVLAAHDTNAVSPLSKRNYQAQTRGTEENTLSETLPVKEATNRNESTEYSGLSLQLDESKSERSSEIKPTNNDLIEQPLDVRAVVNAIGSPDVSGTSTAGQVPPAQIIIEQAESSPAELEDIGEPTAIESMTIFSGTDQAETAFLHEFLLRAKASKAARDAPSQLTLQSSTQMGVQAGSDTTMLSSDPLLEDDIEDPEATSPIKQSLATQTESGDNDKSFSPIRRSARAAQKSNTKLPRPGNLPPVPQFGPVLPSQNFPVPNTIQLRRAIGTEFIFNAKMQQNLAITTRANTKRNQGPAIHVTERLAQLRSEFPIEGLAETGDSQTAMVNSTSTASPSKKGTSRKRKIAKGHASNKVKKNVQWNEILTSFQEPQSFSPSKPTSEDFAEIEAAAQAEAMQAMDNKAYHEELPQLCLHVTNAQASLPTEEVSEAKASAPIESSKSSSSSSSAKLKVRNLRRINIGSVNGTPAPKKTRSQSQSQSLRYHQLPKSVSESTTSTSSAILTTNVLAPQQSNIPKPALSSSSKASALPVVQTGTAKTGSSSKSATSTSILTASTNTSVISNVASGRRSLRGITNGVNP